jgi:hypothetical protein
MKAIEKYRVSLSITVSTPLSRLDTGSIVFRLRSFVFGQLRRSENSLSKALFWMMNASSRGNVLGKTILKNYWSGFVRFGPANAGCHPGAPTPVPPIWREGSGGAWTGSLQLSAPCSVLPALCSSLIAQCSQLFALRSLLNSLGSPPGCHPGAPNPFPPIWSEGSGGAWTGSLQLVALGSPLWDQKVHGKERPDERWAGNSGQVTGPAHTGETPVLQGAATNVELFKDPCSRLPALSSQLFALRSPHSAQLSSWSAKPLSSHLARRIWWGVDWQPVACSL